MLVHFLSILDYDKQRAIWHIPTTYQPLLAAFKYCIHLISLESAISSYKLDRLIEEGKRLAVIFQEFHQWWLVEGDDTAYNKVYKLMQYSRVAGQDSISVSRLLWTNHGQMMVFEGQSIHLKDYREMIHKVHDSTKQLLDECLFGNMERFNLLDLSDLTDDINNTNNGFSFVKFPRNKLLGGRKYMIGTLRSQPEKMYKMAALQNNELFFNPKAIAGYQRKVYHHLSIV